jgi:hypothetical protein
LNIDCISGTLTFDGIDHCGDVVYEQVLLAIQEGSFTDISFVGYSMGGLVLRYCIGKMEANGVFDNIKPGQYISIATPHLGVRRPTGFVWNNAVSIFLGRSGRQFAKEDKFYDNEPLLMVLSDPRYCFYRGLSKFKLSLFANVIYDRSTQFTTSAIEYSNPFRKYARKVPDCDYPSVVCVDETAPFKARGWTRKEVIFATVFMSLLPITLPLWLILSSSFLGLNSVLSHLRAGKGADLTWFINSIKEEKPIMQVNHEQIPKSQHRRSYYRVFIIQNLNLLKWTKVYCHIDAPNSHAAIVQRRDGEAGKDVAKYLAHKVINK